MATMNVSLPEPLKRFVESQVTDGSFGTSSEFVRELVRREQQRQELRAAILDGLSSGVDSQVDADYVARLRERAAALPLS